MRKLPFCLLFVATVLPTIVSVAQTTAPVKDTTSSAGGTTALVKRPVFFGDERPVEISLVSNFRQLQKERKRGVYQDATVTLKLPEGEAVTEGIQLAARGEFRRQECIMPSIMLDFKNPAAPRLSNLKRIKLVSPCSPNSVGEQLVFVEYLIYKMYNLFTDMSFKVRLAKVQFSDVNNKIKSYSLYGFLIEDVDDMAKRNDCREIEGPMYLTEYTNREQMTLVALFQYMIGNTDWSVPNYHNVKLIRSRTDTLALPYVVPYDFDYTGLVNAEYAIPHESLGIETVTQRLYRGFPRTLDELEKSAELFKVHKAAVYDLVRNFSYIKERERNIMLRYLDEFYEVIQSRRNLDYYFIQGARRQ
jgi:hypothetical protein